MDFREEMANDNFVLHITGRIDAANAVKLRDRVTALITDGRIKLLLDMAEVDCIDSSGLATLVACLKSISSAGGFFKIATLQAQTRSMFQMVRLDRVLQLYDNRASALESYLRRLLALPLGSPCERHFLSALFSHGNGVSR